MCGVIGYQPLGDTASPRVAFTRLFDESRVRGLHAYGLAQATDAGLVVHRSFVAAEIPAAFDPSHPAIAHSRYSTSGDWQVLENNQPLVVDGVAMVFNGVIDMGTKPEFEARWNVRCDADNDGEIFLRRLQLGESATEFLGRLTGSFAGAWLAGGRLWVGRNARRPLWYARAYGAAWYASTRDIFRRAGFPMDHVVEVPAGVVEAVS